MGCRFFEVRSQKQRVAGLKNSPRSAQKFNPGFAIKVSDCASQKQYKKMLVRTATGGNLPQSVEVLALKAQNADCIDVAKFLLAAYQGGPGYFDWVVRRSLMAGQRFEQPPRLSAAAAA